MSLTSLRFLYFLAAVTALNFLLPRVARKPLLLFASCYFYWSWKQQHRAVAVLAFSVVSSYILAIAIERNRTHPRRGRMLFACSIILQVALLCFFKYLTPMKLGTLSIVMPLGFSFFAFQIIAFLSDVYTGKVRAERNFIDWALFISFFPKIIEGPIERAGFLTQLKNPPGFRWETFREGALRFFWGLFIKLVITERLALVPAHIDSYYIYMEGYQLIAGLAAYSLQLYTDFAAYTCMARGMAGMLGYGLTGNFVQPYFATGIKDFWRRWHISLSSWLRDYIYIPLGGSRCSRCHKYLNVMATFLVSGIWHGATWNFVVWGLLHGLLQVAEDMLAPVGKWLCNRLKIDKTAFSHRLLVSLWTFALVSVLWLFFWRDSPGRVLDYVNWCLHLKNLPEIFEGGLLRLGLDGRNMFILCAGLTLFTGHSVMAERGTDCMAWLSRQGLWLRLPFYWTMMLLLACSVTSSAKEFVYGAF